MEQRCHVGALVEPHPGFSGLTVSGAAVRGSPGICNSFAFFLFPFSFFFLFSFFLFMEELRFLGKGFGVLGVGFSARALRGPRFFLCIFTILIIRLFVIFSTQRSQHRVTQRAYLFIVDLLHAASSFPYFHSFTLFID